LHLMAWYILHLVYWPPLLHNSSNMINHALLHCALAVTSI